jgi:hypothetical protein
VKRNEASKPLDRLRRRATQDPYFLGHALGRFASERAFGDRELAKFLGCRIERLPHLLACRSPDPEAHRFAADVRKIAEYAGCKEERLLLALRELSVLGVLRALTAATEDAPIRSGLLAARQHRSKPPGKTKRRHDDDRPRGT